MILADLEPLAVLADELELLPGNPRRGDVAAVKRSLERFGQRKPVVARRSDRVVVAGNHTLEAVRELGWDRIAVVWVDDDDATAKAFALADNRTAELGGYDDAELAAMIGEVQEIDPELLAATGWTADDLLELLDSLTRKRAPLTDPDDLPAPPTPRTEPGDLWLCGLHRVLCGDATDLEAHRRVTGGDPVDLVWTDPPYGVGYVGKTREKLTIENDRLDRVEMVELLSAAVTSALEVCRPGAAWYVAAPSGPEIIPFAMVLASAEIWRQTIVWVKDRFVLSRQDFHNRHEPVLYGWAPGDDPAELPAAEYDEAAEAVLYGWAPGAGHQRPPDRRQDNVWEIARPSASRDHPTMKPVELIARALRNSSTPGALVLDPFGGSGSTMLACEQEGRSARLIELDPRFVDVICRRWQEHVGEAPVLEASGVEHDFTA